MLITRAAFVADVRAVDAKLQIDLLSSFHRISDVTFDFRLFSARCRQTRRRGNLGISSVIVVVVVVVIVVVVVVVVIVGVFVVVFVIPLFLMV